MTKTSVMESDKEILVEYHQKYAAAKKRTCILVTAIVTAIVLIVAAVCTLGVYFGVYYSPENDKASIKPTSLMGQSCSDPCILNLVESIPDNLTFVQGAPLHSSTYEGIMSLMANAKETIEIASYYWTLNGQDLPFHDNSSWEGESILETLISSGRDKKIKIKIVQNKPKGRNNNTEALAKYAGAEVRTLDFDKLLGAGIIHTKMWLIDRKHFYVGSANLDWRSYTQNTTHLANSGPSVHEINNQNKSNNQNLQNPENLTSGHVPSAFIPIENTKTTPSTGMFMKPVPVTCPQIDKPINVASSPSISFNNHNSGNIGYTKPNSYDGKSNWSDYKVHFEIVAQLNGWSSEIKALKLISCMQNDALAAIGDINTNCPPSYSELVNTLTRRFAPDNQTELYKTQIDTRIRKGGKVCLNFFREALNDYDLAWVLTQSNIDAIDDALNLALKYEAFHSSHRKPNLRKLAEVSEINTNYTAPKTHFKGGNSGKGACYYCGEPGHFKRDCQKRMTDNNQFIQQMKSGQYNNNQGFNRPNNQTRSEVSTTNSSNQGNC
ncbi:PLD3_4 [Mytilus coruscus]|uniref:PLD3_4 n=1 Tax=Mytilus coruscus TaxID=42192 RepID=A0A6J8CEE4_MYTCO|nr:PLD3_4 [Mytilus coruscus]